MIELPENICFEEKVNIFNQITQQLFDWIGLAHPVLNIQLVPVDQVKGNDYNPNKVAPPEMDLLALSIRKDGMTMPCVVADDGDQWIVVDGFHRRQQVAQKKDIRDSLHGYLPVSKLNKKIEDRITSTVRHNIARGTHQVELSANLIALLKKHNWTDARIGKEIGMDADEVLRLKQLTGLAELFADKEFSKSWS
ncbi:MAG: chromosome partitioning protein ParB [Candidatus Moranbacteria bacterium]|nr:chromosome partitioning protein ParB [Candidatus Moranbacteria bacterium]